MLCHRHADVNTKPEAKSPSLTPEPGLSLDQPFETLAEKDRAAAGTLLQNKPRLVFYQSITLTRKSKQNTPQNKKPNSRRPLRQRSKRTQPDTQQ